MDSKGVIRSQRCFTGGSTDGVSYTCDTASYTSEPANQQIIHDVQLDTDVMTALFQLLDKGSNKRHCKVLTPGFYEALTNTNGTYRKRAWNKLSLTAAARCTQKQDMF